MRCQCHFARAKWS